MTSFRSAIPLTVITLLAALAPPARAQAGRERPARDDARPGTVAGTVVDAATGAPVASAIVVLEPESGGAFPRPGGFAAATRSVATDSAGRYVFTDLPSGAYRLRVSSLSYRPYSLVVEVGDSGSAVSVGLEAAPIALQPMRARSHARGPYVAGDPFSDDGAAGRLMAFELLRRRYLPTDARELTEADVVEGVTLGEPDVFRAVQRLPGVSTRSGYTAELWTRGAPWSHTRVYFDGVPIFNPLHALGVLSGVGSSAVGAVWFQPGVRPAAVAEGAAGVMDLGTRRGFGTGELHVRADASLMTAGLALDQRVLDGRFGWMLAGRRNYLDWLTALARRATGDDRPAYPYGFGEVTARLDAAVGARSSVDASLLWEGDHLSSDGIAGADPLRANWGNSAAQATLTTHVGALNLRQSIGASAYSGSTLTDSAWTFPVSVDSRRFGHTRVRWTGARTEIAPGPIGEAAGGWSAGWSLERQTVDYFGPMPVSVPSGDLANAGPGPGGSYEGTLVSWERSLDMLSLWGERAWSPSPRWSLRTGLRAETGTPVRGGGALRLAPRLVARFSPLPEVAFSAGYARVYQYAQAVAPGGVQLASLVSTDAWILAGPDVPPLRADIATAGVEAWIAPGRLASLNAFTRYADGAILPDPRPGPVFGRTALVAGTNLASGVEVAVRQLTGPITASASYTFTRSRVYANGLEFPAGADRTHVLDLSAMVRPLPSLRLGAAFTAATGVPFTETIADSATCDARPGCNPGDLPWAGEPHAARAPMFASLDLLADWSLVRGRTEIGLYFQLRNALGRENATIYTGGGSGCLPVGCDADDLRNAYERGIPRLPVLGLRVRR